MFMKHFIVLVGPVFGIVVEAETQIFKIGFL